jgi:hypothetical protein
LKNFATKDGIFSILNIKKNEIIEDIPYRDQCYENYYYGKDKIWEQKLVLS